MEPIQYEHLYVFENIPLQWIQSFEIFYPDLKNFPVTYVHVKTDSGRAYGFPVNISIFDSKQGKCSIKVTFLCNKKQSDKEFEQIIKKELEGRFGISNPLTYEDIDNCTSDERMKDFLKIIWKKASLLFGESYPYGKLFDEMYSIIRFVAAWNPKTGKQSEMRAVYNFQSLFGEKIEIQGDWSFLDFFLIPTYEEVQKLSVADFPKFQEMYQSLEKIWPIHWKLKGTYKITCNTCHKEFANQKYTIDDVKNLIQEKKKGKTHGGHDFSILKEGIEMFAADGGWGDNIGEFDQKFAKVWEEKGIIDSRQRHVLNKLVSAFNRSPGRTTYFVWALMSINQKPYQNYDKEHYVEFYKLAEKTNFIGVSQKVVGCFLQQGFEHEQMIPIDTWVESFHKGPLGIESKFDFFNSFSMLGKLERMIWQVSQAKKTNADPLMNVLWCMRFGETGNNVIRFANPLSCYACEFHKQGCLGFENIRNKMVLIKDEKDVTIETIETEKNKDKGKKIVTKEIIQSIENNEFDFVCITQNGIPKKIFKKNGKNIQLFDEFSESRITNNTTLESNNVISVDEFIATLGPNIPPNQWDVEE